MVSKKKKTKYISPPMKWDNALNKYVPDLPLMNSKVLLKQKPNNWALFYLILEILGVAFIIGWLVRIIFG